MLIAARAVLDYAATKAAVSSNGLPIVTIFAGRLAFPISHRASPASRGQALFLPWIGLTDMAGAVAGLVSVANDPIAYIRC